MKKVLFYFLCLSLSSCSPNIKVLSYNIFHGENPYRKSQSNLKQVSNLINDQNPDIVFLQEVDSMTNRSLKLGDGDIVKVLGGTCKMNYRFAKAIDYDGGGYGEVLLAKKSSEMISVSLPSLKGGEGRVMVVSRKNGKIQFAGTHLCHQFQANRMAQLKAIVAYYEKEDEAMILGGDFNFVPDSEEYQYISQYFYDAAKLKGNIQNTFPADKPSKRIDYIFLSKNKKWKVKELQIIESQASDHLPLFGIFR